LTFKSKTTTTLKNTLNLLAEQLSTILKNPPLGSCLAIAGPIIERHSVQITNYEHDDRDIKASDLNPFGFPPQRTLFINDLEGTCAGILSLNELGTLEEYYISLWNPTNPNPAIDPSKSSLVLAMGTGLGTALITTDFSRKSHNILPMEAGHIFITELGSANQHYAKEREMIEFVSNMLYKNEHSIEFEDICSGRGIGYVYKWLTGEDKEAGEIVQKAEEKDANALATIAYVYRFLIRDAQNLCIFSQAKSVFLSGDNQVRNLQFVLDIKDLLGEEFLNHVKREWLTSVDVWTQHKDANFNMFGALYLARKHST